MVADVPVTPQALASLRTASAAGQTLGTHALSLGEDPVVDPLVVRCTAGSGDTLDYALGDLNRAAGLHGVRRVGPAVRATLPNPITVTPGFHQAFFTDTTPVAPSDFGIAMSGPGGSLALGAIKPNNIAPTLGSVSAPDGVEGSPIQFSTSATGPCAAG